MATTSPEDPRGLIDLNARMPVGDSPYGSAYGVSTAARIRPQTPNIDEFLKPEPAKKAAQPAMVVARAVPITKSPVADGEFAPPPFEPVVKLQPNQEQLLALASEPPPPPASGDDTTRYADREAQNQNLEQFRGGDAIVITTGTLIVILLVVILILLLT